MPAPSLARPAAPGPSAARPRTSCAARRGPLSLPHRAPPRPPAAGPPTGPANWFLRAPSTVDSDDSDGTVAGAAAPSTRLALPPSPPTRAPAAPPPPATTALLTTSLAALAAFALPGLDGFDFDKPASVAQALGVLAAIVAVHEAGHFSCARALGVRVSQFAIGFGPPLLARTGADGVEYSLRAIPLGGYVAFPDDDPEADFEPDDPDLLKNRPLLQRAAVISAGVAANLVAAGLVLLAQATSVGVAELDLLPGVAIPRVLPGSVAEAAGVEAGDIIASINGAPIPATPGAVAGAVASIQRSAGLPLKLDLIRGDATGRAPGSAPALRDGARGGAATPDGAPPTITRLTLTLTPAGSPASPLSPAGDGRIGVQLATHATVRRVVATDLGSAAAAAGREYRRLASAVVGGLVGLVSNFGEAAKAVAGPVAIVAAGAEVARADVGGLFQVREGREAGAGAGMVAAVRARVGGGSPPGGAPFPSRLHALTPSRPHAPPVRGHRQHQPGRRQPAPPARPGRGVPRPDRPRSRPGRGQAAGGGGAGHHGEWPAAAAGDGRGAGGAGHADADGAGRVRRRVGEDVEERSGL